MEGWILWNGLGTGAAWQRIVVQQSEAGTEHLASVNNSGQVYVSGAASGVFGDLPSGRWVHLAVVFDGSERLLFIDGQLISSGSVGGSATIAPDRAIYIGGGGSCGTCATDYAFTGMIGSVRISEGALYEESFAPRKYFSVADDTVGLWNLLDGSGLVASDSGPGGADGDITGSTWIQNCP